ncbi:MAG: phosphoglycerate mutase [Nitrospirae bacterium]|nr:phosphoglycerate mutase [Nitrospirota bacterium]
MKYIILHGEGMADVPRQDLGGKTPLQAAATPHMDGLARNGELGLVTSHAEGLGHGSEVLQLAVLGYDPRKFYPGPAPLEAASLGVVVEEHDVVYRCTMVTLRAVAQQSKGPQVEIKKLGPQVMMEDDTAGGIDTEDARELIEAVNEQLGSETIQFYPGTGHRHLMVWVGGKARAVCADPHDVKGKSIGDALPSGDGADILRKLMDASLIILRDHPINDQRREAGLKPANCLWLWGPGRAPKLPKLTEQYEIVGTIISTSDLHRGVGICAGLEAVDPSVLTESGGTDFLSRGEAALRELGKKDLVYVHAQMPVEVAEGADPKARVKVVEEFDQKVVGTIVNGLQKLGPHRVLLLCDATSDVRSRTAPPQALYASYEGPAKTDAASARGFNEADAAEAGSRDATRLMARLFPRS